MRRVELSALLPRRSGKLADQVLVNRTEYVFAVIAFVVDVVDELDDAVKRFGTFIGG